MPTIRSSLPFPGPGYVGQPGWSYVVSQEVALIIQNSVTARGGVFESWPDTDPLVPTGSGDGPVTINFVIEGGASAITPGIKGDLIVDFACTLNSWTIVADTAGAIVIDIWKAAYASFPPTDSNSICPGKEPTISASNAQAQDTSITDWMTDELVAGDVLRFNVDSCTSIKRATISFKATRT